MTDYKAKCDSYGFRGQFWEKDQIAEDVTDTEKKDPSIKHFEEIDVNKKTKKRVEKIEEVASIPTNLHSDYLVKFGQEVPNRYKNDLEWIKSKLVEEVI